MLHRRPEISLPPWATRPWRHLSLPGGISPPSQRGAHLNPTSHPQAMAPAPSQTDRRGEERERVRSSTEEGGGGCSHARDAVAAVAGDVEPGAGVDERGVPALEHAAGVPEAAAQRRERVPPRSLPPPARARAPAPALPPPSPLPTPPSCLRPPDRSVAGSGTRTTERSSSSGSGGRAEGTGRDETRRLVCFFALPARSGAGGGVPSSRLPPWWWQSSKVAVMSSQSYCGAVDHTSSQLATARRSQCIGPRLERRSQCPLGGGGRSATLAPGARVPPPRPRPASVELGAEVVDGAHGLAVGRAKTARRRHQCRVAAEPTDDEAAETKGAGVAARQGASARGEERGVDLGDGVHIKNRGSS
jgi:hypothetical protein